MIANIAGEDEDQFVAMAEMLGGEPGLAAVELNISCPNVSHGLDLGIDAGAGRPAGAAGPGGLPAADHRQADAERDRHRRRSPRAAAEGGADAVSLVNTFRGMAVDWRTRRPILANDVGGLSGPAIKPMALRMVWDVARALPDLPIIGIGGIAKADDALEFLVAGASAVQVGTATFYDPTASERLLDDLTRRLAEAGRRARHARSSAPSGRTGGRPLNDEPDDPV